MNINCNIQLRIKVTILLYLIIEPILDKNLILNTLQSHKEELKGFGVNRIGLFGSYSNNKSNPNSDIDLLVDIRLEKKLLKISWL